MSRKKAKSQSGYRIPKGTSQSDRAKIMRVIDRGIKRQTPASQIKQELRDRGLGYRDTNLYHDIRRRKAEHRPIMTTEGKVAGYYRLQPQARKESLNWFDNVFERYRSDYKAKTGKTMSPKQFLKLWSKAKSQSYDNLEYAEIEELEDIWEYYKDIV